ncbi:MAG: choice-of-anchor D domain-containing protein, partial [Muribaculaceae bacterium]|nr:choice-of-anchor D domain-containing protein [Muribaculaceae bacterium]
MLGVNENGTAYDAVFLEISQPYMALLSGDGDFGNVQIGEAKTATITVMNTGEEAFTPVVNCDNSAFTITTTGSGLLASGASRSYVVTFAPTALQDYNGTFTLTAAELAEVDFQYTTPLSGTGVGEDTQGTVADGNNPSEMFPVYGQYFNYGTSSQMIYPVSMLAAQGIQTGDIINSLTFFAQSGNVPDNIRRSTVTLRLGNTTSTTVTSTSAMSTNRNSCTQVFSGNLTGNSSTLTINLSTPYVYQGGNLIVDFVVAANYIYPASCSWVGSDGYTNASYNTRNRSATNTNNPYTNQGSFLPKIEIGYTTVPELEATTSLDFGTVSIGDGNALTAIVKNDGNADVQASLTISPNPPFSVANNTITIAAKSFAIIPVTFMPNEEDDYSGTLAIVAGNETINIPLTGKAIYTGPEAIRDTTFFTGITYTWPITGSNANTNESSLGDIATDPEQIIAMLREVYMNKSIPGNYKRGFTATGGKDHDYDVPYTGVGIIESNTATECANSYGWNIPGTVLPGDNYRYMDPEQYKPFEEGVTLLLVEMVDDFTKPDGITKATTTYEELKNYIEMSIKSVRIVPDARRTGEGIERGTLFKIDCDKMNKFYLLAKGQLLWFDNQKSNIGYSNPVYYNSTYTDEGLAFDYIDGPALLCHMFEQFSPTTGNAEQAKADLYWDLVDMQSFGVIHDCPNVPFVQNGHHFMMYGSDSDSKDCQDVRDMMFFVPDYRMLEHLQRGSGGLSANRSQDYFRYNTRHQPTMGLFVIHQNEIPEGTKDLTITNPAQEVTGLYKHQLSWKSNLDDFLPGEEQYYELWEIVVDDFGMESYQPVYQRNADGSYVMANGEKVPIKLERLILATGEEGFTYENVYVDMKEYSQTKTYVIRGRDQGEFLSLQMSNQQEIVIPGTDPNEKARMIGATYYSRYNPANEKNCYSNRIELSNNGMTLTTGDLSNGLNFYRSSRAAQVDDNGNVVTDASGNIQYVTAVNKELVATGSANGSTLTLTLSNQGVSTDYPNGTVSGTAAGYHANTTLSFPYT